MKAEDIRALNENCQEKALKTESVSKYDGAMRSLELSILAEIAAQLAEQNIQLKRIADGMGCQEGE